MERICRWYLFSKLLFLSHSYLSKTIQKTSNILIWSHLKNQMSNFRGSSWDLTCQTSDKGQTLAMLYFAKPSETKRIQQLFSPTVRLKRFLLLTSRILILLIIHLRWIRLLKWSTQMMKLQGLSLDLVPRQWEMTESLISTISQQRVPQFQQGQWSRKCSSKKLWMKLHSLK